MSTSEETLNDITGDLHDLEFSRSEGGISTSTGSTESTKFIEGCNRIQEEYHSAVSLTEDKKDNQKVTDKEKNNDVKEMFKKLQRQLKAFKNRIEFQQIEKYENDLRKKLNQELEELDFTMKETSATVENILRMKKQRYYVKKELSKMTRNLSKSKQEELKEMELVVAVYDKELLRRWHLIKKTNSPHSLEGFLNNVVGKRQSIDIIYKMAKDRLELLKKKGATSNFPALSDKIINEEEPFQEDSLSED